MTETERYHAAPRLPEDRSTILSTGIHSRSMYETPGVAAYECDLAHRAGVLRTGGSPPLELCAACQRPQSRATYVAGRTWGDFVDPSHVRTRAQLCADIECRLGADSLYGETRIPSDDSSACTCVIVGTQTVPGRLRRCNAHSFGPNAAQPPYAIGQ